MKNTVESAENKKSRKRRAIIFVAVLFAVGIICAAVLLITELAENREESGPTNMYSDELNSYVFYKPDYELDVTEVEEYMELDRLFYYKDGAEEYGIESDFERFGDAVMFFKEYFDAVIAGDTDAYNEMFTEKYYETNSRKVRFAPQMIYDIHVSRLWEKDESNGERMAFDVSYRIYRNNGTFRNDIDSGAAKPLYFELVRDGDEIKIDRITYYTDRS